MLHLKGFSAWITIEGGGKEAKEYDVQEKNVSGKAEKSCFIASEVGQRFSVNWEDEEFDDDSQGATCGFVYVDGRYIGKKLICRSGKYATESGIACRDTVVNPEGKVCPFVFGRTELSDDNEALERKDLDQEIGKIILKIQRVTITGRKRQKKAEVLRGRQRKGDLSIGKVHESVKELSAEHRVVLGDPISTPWAIFTFEYRSLDVLKRLKIAPRSPKAKTVPLPSPSPHPRPPSPGLEYVSPPPESQAPQSAPQTESSPRARSPAATTTADDSSDLPLPPSGQGSINDAGLGEDVKPVVKKEEDKATLMKVEVEEAKPGCFTGVKHESQSVEPEMTVEQQIRAARAKELRATLLDKRRELLKLDILATEIKLEEIERESDQGTSSRPAKKARVDREVKREISTPARAFTPGQIYDLTGDSD